MMRPRSLRFRMMLLFFGVVGVLMAASYMGFYALLLREVRAQLDRQLLDTARPVIADLIKDPAEQDVNELNVPDEYFELLDSSGRILQHSRNFEGRALDFRGSGPHGSQAVFRTTLEGGRGPLRVALVPFRRGAENLILALAIPSREADRALATFRHTIPILLLSSLLLAAAISAWYVGRSLRPVKELTQRARQTTERVTEPGQSSLWTPLVVANPHDELGRLAETFNQLFTRVDAALGQLRQFVTDASHELRTPLAVLQGETELLLAERRTPEEYRQRLRVIHAELEKLSRMVEGLFTLAMADAGQLRLAREPVYLNEVLEESCSLASQLAQVKGIVIQRDLKRDVPYVGDEVFLRQLFLIFLENAIKYSPPNSRICVSLEQSDGLARARFEDEGVGIASEHLSRIFERFYRVPLRSEAGLGGGEGHSGGLGLAIAQAIARAQGGSIECRSAPGSGSTFTVNLPLEAQS